jgi:flagellum-specific ATP synthase
MTAVADTVDATGLHAARRPGVQPGGRPAARPDAMVRLAAARMRLREMPLGLRSGRLVRVKGLILEVEGLALSLGQHALISVGQQRAVEAVCISFDHAVTQLMPLDADAVVSPGATVYPADTPADVGGRYAMLERPAALPLGRGLLGRVVDGFGRPLDGLGVTLDEVPGTPPAAVNPLHRVPIQRPLDVGVRAVNGLLSVGRGQRVGIFAGTGVGKSVLLGMLARHCEADVVVIGLIGERGREVREFLEDVLGPQRLRESVMVVATADTVPLARVRGAVFATEVATWFRDRGHHVLLIMDSLTRYAMACREIALGLGEPPVSRGYPPSVFQRLPEMVERAGNGADPAGSLTAFYTVLLESDDSTDPVADAIRGVLDGHVVLSRVLAEMGHYPAIDLERSISRSMPRVAGADHLRAAMQAKRLFGRYMRSRELVALGAYTPGSDAELDTALAFWPALSAYLQQAPGEPTDWAQSLARLNALTAPLSAGAPHGRPPA